MWKCQTSGNGHIVVLSPVLFLRAWTPARLWADWRAAILAAVPSMWMERGRGFFRPGGSRAVAALVRARTAGFRPRKLWVCTSHPGVQRTAAPYLTLCASAVSAVKRSRARKGADARIPAREAGVCTTHTGASRTCGTRPTDSPRFYCEGLEEKFLERGAPAPLSVRLIDTTCASAKIWHSPSAYRSRPGRSLALQCRIYCAPEWRAPLNSFCSGVLGTPSVSPHHQYAVCTKTVPQMRADKARWS